MLDSKTRLVKCVTRDGVKKMFHQGSSATSHEFIQYLQKMGAHSIRVKYPNQNSWLSVTPVN